MDLYEILGVERTADREAIRRAYRAKAKTLHPDAGGGEVEFQQIQLAHTILTDDDRRAHYDATGGINTGSVENERAAVLEILANTFTQVIANSQQDPATWDLLSSVRAEINKKVAEGEGQLQKLTTILAHFDSVAMRVKAKKTKKADPMVLHVLASQRRLISDAKVKDKATVKRWRTALEMLAGYKYEWNKPPQPPSSTYDIYNQQMGGSFFGFKQK